MGSLVPDQQQAQVPVAVEGASEPHEELANSTSGAAYELETSGDGEARQMAASNDDTAAGDRLRPDRILDLYPDFIYKR